MEGSMIHLWTKPHMRSTFSLISSSRGPLKEPVCTFLMPNATCGHTSTLYCAKVVQARTQHLCSEQNSAEMCFLQSLSRPNYKWSLCVC